MRDILLLGTAREKSTRVKDKMTRPFHNTTLFKLYLDKLEDINKTKKPFNNIILALNKEDKKLLESAKSYNIKIQERSYFSANDASLPKDVFHYLDEYKEKYVMWVNGCLPFLKLKTIIDAGNYFIEHKNINSLHCVKVRQNWFWNPNANYPFNLEKTSDLTTQQSLPIYESVHCFHIHKIEDIIEKNRFWSFKKNDPYLHMLKDSVEFFDIDTQTEFNIAELIWRNENE